MEEALKSVVATMVRAAAACADLVAVLNRALPAEVDLLLWDMQLTGELDPFA